MPVDTRLRGYDTITSAIYKVQLFPDAHLAPDGTKKGK
jgi:hypothetical protein